MIARNAASKLRMAGKFSVGSAQSRRVATTRVGKVFMRYDELLKSHRLLTSTGTGAVLALAGDAFTQSATCDNYDGVRGLCFGAFGAFVTGPVNYVWLTRLDSLVLKLAPGGGVRSVLCKVLVQSAFFQPVIYVPLFFGFSAVFRSWSTDTLLLRIKTDYPSTLRSLWGFWTPICVFTFSVVPVRQQAIFFSGISLVWNALLSFITNHGVSPAKTDGIHAETAVDYLPSHQPPPSIMQRSDVGGDSSPSSQSIIGFLLGPGLM